MIYDIYVYDINNRIKNILSLGLKSAHYTKSEACMVKWHNYNCIVVLPPCFGDLQLKYKIMTCFPDINLCTVEELSYYSLQPIAYYFH